MEKDKEYWRRGDLGKISYRMPGGCQTPVAGNNEKWGMRGFLDLSMPES
jgi:hypothetical protein